ncbi:MAG: molybdopterin-dependent oxidoreductase, partial [Chloroflexota bacterium]
MTTTHYRTCNLCEAMCGLEITLEGDQILSIQGDKNDPFSKGHICPKAVALQDIYHDPDRLKFPVRRTDTGWEQISWDEAFTEVVTNLKAIQTQYGRDAVGIYQGNPTVHNYGTMLFAPQFVRTLRTKNRFTATSADQLPHHFAAYFMFGHQLLLPIPDIDHTDFFLIFGANPLASNGSIMTAAGVENRIKAIQARGGKVIVVDPRRTETAKKADQHLFIKPGYDVLLLLGLLHTIYNEGLVDPAHLAPITPDIDEIEATVADFSPEIVAPRIGLSPQQIRQLARDFCAAERAVCYGRMGVSTQSFGGVAQWLVNVINIVTGNFDRPGGAMFPTPALDVVAITGRLGAIGNYGRWASRVRGRPA